MRVLLLLLAVLLTSLSLCHADSCFISLTAQKSVTLGKAAAILRKHHIDFRKIIAMVPSYFLFG